MLAEVRALREGIIIADQLPTAMAPEVIKNTNIKLVHRLTSGDDRQLIGSTMAASGLQLERVATYRPGEALMSYEGLLRPFELRVKELKGHGTETPNDDELYQLMIQKPAFYEMIKCEEQRKWKKLKEDTIELKQKEVEGIKRMADFEAENYSASQITEFFWQLENVYTGICILRQQYMKDCNRMSERFVTADQKEKLNDIIQGIGETLHEKMKEELQILSNTKRL